MTAIFRTQRAARRIQTFWRQRRATKSADQTRCMRRRNWAALEIEVSCHRRSIGVAWTKIANMTRVACVWDGAWALNHAMRFPSVSFEEVAAANVHGNARQ